MFNVLIPMAGAGSRFAEAGYTKPKPFVDVAGKPMITRVLENLDASGANFILVAQRAHIEQEKELVASIQSQYDAQVVEVDGLSAGTACTILAARKQIDSSVPLVVANSDQIVDFKLSAFIGDCLARQLDGSMVTFFDREKDEKWSFANIDSNGRVIQVKEKVAISNYATVGIYMFTKGSDFVYGADRMIAQNERVNNEFYTCPVYNHLIAAGRNIGAYEVDAQAMHGIGTPNDLERYIELIT